MSTRSLRLASNTAIFASGTVTTQVIALATVPFVTAHLTPESYGSVELLLTTIALLLPVASLGISEAVIRFGMDDSFNFREVISSGFAVAALGTIAGLMIWSAIAMATGLKEFIWVGIAMLVGVVAREVAAGYLRASNRIKVLVVGGIVQSLLFACAVVLLMGLYAGGLSGYIVAILVSNLVVSSAFVVMAVRGGSVSVSSVGRDTLVRMLRFSIPLVPNALLWLAVASISRFFLYSSHGADAVGLYGVAVRLTTVLVGMTSVFMQAWQLSAIEERDALGSAEFESSVFAAFSGVMFVGASALLFALKPLIVVLFADSYYPAWISVPPLLFGVLFLAFATFSGTQYKVRMVTSRALWTSLAAAVLVVILSALIVPKYGALGAGFATFGGYFLLWLLRVFDVGFPLRPARAKAAFFISLGILGIQGLLLYLPEELTPGLWPGAVALLLLILVNIRSLTPLLAIGLGHRRRTDE